MRNLVGGVMTPPYEGKLLGVTNYYSGWVENDNFKPITIAFFRRKIL